jgi:putative permease
MVAILVFGGLWGFWGVFFAIPLATLVQAILVTWPREEAVQG